VNWDLTTEQRELLDFTARLIDLFHTNPLLRRRSFFTGRPIPGEGAKDLTWLRPDGGETTDDDWGNPANHVIGMLVHGEATDEVDERGRPIYGDTNLMLLNGGPRSRYFVLPRMEGSGAWQEVLNTARPGARLLRKEGLNLVAHSLILLRFGEIG
jgi:glycogen operon protein